MRERRESVCVRECERERGDGGGEREVSSINVLLAID